MKKVILLGKGMETILNSNVNEYTPIFAKRDGILSGMLVKETTGWILRVGGRIGSSGHFSSRGKCIEKALSHGYEFFIDV